MSGIYEGEGEGDSLFGDGIVGDGGGDGGMIGGGIFGGGGVFCASPADEFATVRGGDGWEVDVASGSVVEIASLRGGGEGEMRGVGGDEVDGEGFDDDGVVVFVGAGERDGTTSSEFGRVC